MLHNTEDGCLSTCPAGGSLESQLCVTTFEKGITIIFMLCLVLTFGRVSESASSSGLGISRLFKKVNHSRLTFLFPLLFVPTFCFFSFISICTSHSLNYALLIDFVMLFFIKSYFNLNILFIFLNKILLA